MEHQLNAYEREQNKFYQQEDERLTDRAMRQLAESVAQWEALLEASENEKEYADTYLRQYDRGYIQAMKVVIRDAKDILRNYHYEG